MDQENLVPPPSEQQWEPPMFEEIRVSAEVTAYMGARDDWN